MGGRLRGKEKEVGTEEGGGGAGGRRRGDRSRTGRKEGMKEGREGGRGETHLPHPPTHFSHSGIYCHFFSPSLPPLPVHIFHQTIIYEHKKR